MRISKLKNSPAYTKQRLEQERQSATATILSKFKGCDPIQFPKGKISSREHSVLPGSFPWTANTLKAHDRLPFDLPLNQACRTRAWKVLNGSQRVPTASTAVLFWEPSLPRLRLVTRCLGWRESIQASFQIVWYRWTLPGLSRLRHVLLCGRPRIPGLDRYFFGIDKK
jgi:hypothetical protein